MSIRKKVQEIERDRDREQMSIREKVPERERERDLD